MSQQTVTAKQVTVEWDDSVVFVFSFLDGAGTQQFAGFQHVGIQVQSGTSTQVTKTTQNVTGVQVSNDPQSWMESVKNAARNSSTSLVIVFDDQSNLPFTTFTNRTFSLQELFSIAG